MGYSKNKNEDQGRSNKKGVASRDFHEPTTNCVYTTCKVQGKHPKQETARKIATILLICTCYTLVEGTKPPRSYEIADKAGPYNSLRTPECNPGNLDMTQSCHVEGSYSEELLIYRCNFKDMCPSGNPPICVDVDGGMVFICAPEIAKCSEGYRWKAELDSGDPSSVYLIVEKCPDGFYQPTSSNCFHACKFKHENLRDIQVWYTIFSEGDNVNPTMVYCNYLKGYFNREGRFLLNYDQNDDPYFCGNLNDNNPCVEGQMPLPNGTCVFPCKNNECRDVNNNFICATSCRDQNGDRHAFTDVPVSNENKDECDRETRFCRNGVCKKFFNDNRCQCNAGFEYDEVTKRCVGKDMNFKTTTTTTTTKTTTITNEIDTWIMIVCFIVIVLLIAAGIFFLYKKCKPQAQHVENGNGQHEVSSTGTDLITDELSTVTGSEGSTVSADNTTNRIKHNCSSLIFNEAQNVNIINNYVQCDEKVNDKCYEDPGTLDNNRITEKEGLLACHIDAINKKEDTPGLSSRSNTAKKNVYSNDTKVEVEREHLLDGCQKDEDRHDILYVRDFKKVINDTNTQAGVRCLMNNMLSCGGIVFRNRVIGSAFCAGPKYVITAFHVVRDIARDLTDNSDYDFTLLEVQNLTINFNDSVLNQHKRDIQLKYRYHDAVCDCAVLEIKDVESHENLPKPLLLWKHDISHMKGEQVKLIGYGNDENPNEKHEETCVIIKESDFTTRYREALASLHQNAQEYKNSIPGYDKSSVDRGYIAIENDAFIKFDCFMEKGLSGGPVITNEGHSSKVIGIVKGGMPDFYYELSPEKKESFERKYLFEVGVKMQKIYDTMIREDPVLASELFPED